MTWAKLSDDFSDDTWRLSDAAFRLHAEALVWSNRKLLDCIIPKEDLRHLKRPEAVAELLEHGFWADIGSAYEIRHHARYQRLREAVIKQQETNRENGSKGGRPKGKAREQAQDVTNQKTESLTESKTEGLTGGFQDQPGTTSGKNPAIARAKTESLTESQSGSDCERDRTGSVQGGGSQTVCSDHPYPTDPRAIEWRRKIDAKGIKSEAELLEVADVTSKQATLMWQAAFPELMGGA